MVSAKTSKKPMLNQEILEEIFIQLLQKSRFYEINKNIEKFMLSGSQNFQTALNYFQRINEVNCYSHEMHVLKNDEIINRTLYKCNLYKPILKAIGTSIKKITISAIPTGEFGSNIFKYLIQEGLEIVQLDINLPDEYFSKICNLTSIKRFYSPLKLSDLLKIKSKSQSFGFRTNFKELIQAKSSTSMPWVKEFRMFGSFEVSDFTKESMETFTKYISETFPNIESMKLSFECLNPTWKPVYSKMKEIHPNWFNGFSTNIKGEINCGAYCKGINSKIYNELISEDNEYASNDFQARKEFKIHQNLSYCFCLTC